MTFSTNKLDFSGNHMLKDGVQLTYDTMTNVPIPAATQPSVVSGTGAPTFTAPQGTLYLNLTGNSGSTRAYLNTTGSTTWTAISTVA